MSASRHNRILARARKRGLEMEPKLADLVQPIIERAGKDASRRFRQYVTDHLAAAASARRLGDLHAIAGLSLHQRRSLLASLGFVGSRSGVRSLTAADLGVTSASTMICVKPLPEQAAAIADPDGAAPESLHVTLAYLGEVEGTLRDVADALAPVAAAHAPLTGEVGGYGQFLTPGGPVGILLPEVPGLVELRVDVTEALVNAGIDYGRDHGFEAHLTVDPDHEPGELDEMLPLSGNPLYFGELLIVRGDIEEYALPFSGVPAVTAAGEPPKPPGFGTGKKPRRNPYTPGLRSRPSTPPSWSVPAADEVVDIEKLVRQIHARTAPVRQAVVESIVSPSVERVGIAFDAKHPLVGKALAGSSRQITEIANTTRGDVMTAIRASYDAGLSIPDTAKAIEAALREQAPVRAALIARTELVGIVNGASMAATSIVQSATGTAYAKRWLTASGAPNPRHELYDGLDGQEVPLDGYFDVGGFQLQYPGDPDGPPEEVCNCRCTVIYIEQGGGESESDAEDG